MEFIGSIFSVLFLIPYFGWGVYTLRRRYRHHEEFTMALEAGTLAGVGFFYAVEIALLGTWMAETRIRLMFSILGLLVAGVALYGPMAISLLSRVLVDAMLPGEISKTNEPRYGPAEALERQGDYQGAFHEYMVILRIFPKDVTCTVRIADNLAKLGRFPEAAQWFERALSCLQSPEKSLPIVNRLVEIYSKEPGRLEDAKRALQLYLDNYPHSIYVESVRHRLDRLCAPPLPENPAPPLDFS